MSTHHYQCQHCYTTTNLWYEEDGTDDFYGGATEDCGCQAAAQAIYDQDDDD